MHGKFQNRESKAEIILDNGVITEIRFAQVRGKKSLEGTNRKDFETIVERYAEEIVQK